MKVWLNTDGGVRTGGWKGPTKGQSGPGSWAYVIRGENYKIIERGGGYLENTTVSCAEWSAVIGGLAACQRLGVTDVTVRSDSQLVVMQANGVWAVRAKHLIPYYEEVMEMSKEFEHFEVVWVPRSENSAADQVTREIYAEAQAQMQKEAMRGTGD